MPFNEASDCWDDLQFNLQFRDCLGKDFSLISLLEIFVDDLDIANSYRCTYRCCFRYIFSTGDGGFAFQGLSFWSNSFFLIDNMSSPGKDNFRMKSYKNNALNPQEMRRRREEEGIQLRKQKREEQVSTLMSCWLLSACEVKFTYVKGLD